MCQFELLTSIIFEGCRSENGNETFYTDDVVLQSTRYSFFAKTKDQQNGILIFESQPDLTRVKDEFSTERDMFSQADYLISGKNSVRRLAKFLQFSNYCKFSQPVSARQPCAGGNSSSK